MHKRIFMHMLYDSELLSMMRHHRQQGCWTISLVSRWSRGPDHEPQLGGPATAKYIMMHRMPEKMPLCSVATGCKVLIQHQLELHSNKHTYHPLCYISSEVGVPKPHAGCGWDPRATIGVKSSVFDYITSQVGHACTSEAACNDFGCDN